LRASGSLDPDISLYVRACYPPSLPPGPVAARKAIGIPLFQFFSVFVKIDWTSRTLFSFPAVDRVFATDLEFGSQPVLVFFSYAAFATR